MVTDSHSILATVTPCMTAPGCLLGTNFEPRRMMWGTVVVASLCMYETANLMNRSDT